MSRRSRLAFALLVVAAGCSKKEKLLATLDGSVSAVAADASAVYVAVSDLGKTSIVRISRTTAGKPETILRPAELVAAMAVAGDGLILGELAFEGGEGPLVVDGATAKDPEALGKAVSAGTTNRGVIARLRLADRSVTRLATFDGTPNELVVDGGAVYVSSIGVFHEGTLETEKAGTVVALASIDHPGAVRTIADHLTVPDALAIDATSVYVTDHNGTWKIPKAGGALTSAPSAPTPSVARESAFLRTLVDTSGTIRVETKDGRTRVVAN